MTETTMHALLPDPFLFRDGRRVATDEDWQRRRVEIREQLLTLQYGTMPGAPALTETAHGSWQLLEGGRRRRTDTLTFIADASRPDVRIPLEVRFT